MSWVMNAVSVALELFGVSTLIAIAMVVIVEAKAKKIRQSIITAFTFKFSFTSLLFFHPYIMIYWAAKEKSYMELDHRSMFYSKVTVVSESELLNEMHERLVKDFLDMLILMRLMKGPMSVYDLVKFVLNRFNLLNSSELVHSSLSYLEREEFIKSTEDLGKKVYNLTSRGEERVKVFLKSKEKVLGLVLNLFIGQ